MPLPKSYIFFCQKPTKILDIYNNYIWSFTKGQTILETCDIRSTSPLSDKISKDLKKRGMKFVRSTTIYAYLQAIGVYDAHLKDCDCYNGNLQNSLDNNAKEL